MLCKESVENTCTSLNPIPTMPIFWGPDCPGSLNFWKLRELIQPLKPSEYCPFVRSLMSNLDPPTNKSSKRRSRALSRRKKIVLLKWIYIFASFMFYSYLLPHLYHFVHHWRWPSSQFSGGILPILLYLYSCLIGLGLLKFGWCWTFSLQKSIFHSSFQN